MPSVDRLAISDARVSRSRTCRFMVVSLDTSRLLTRLQSFMCSSLRRAICCPNDTHTLLDSRHTAPVLRGARLGQFTLSLDLVFSAADFAGFIRLPIASSRPSFPGHGPASPFSARMALEKLGKHHSLHAPTRANIPTSPYGSRRFRVGMEHAKQANGSGQELSIGHSSIFGPQESCPKKGLSPHGRSGRKRAASRNQGNWVAAIAGAMTWLRVSSSGGIGDAASVSVNAMGRRPGRGRRR